VHQSCLGRIQINWEVYCKTDVCMCVYGMYTMKSLFVIAMCFIGRLLGFIRFIRIPLVLPVAL